MAITVVSNFTSGKYYLSNNPINCTINSNNNGSCNFRYICDLYINGTKVFSDKLFPDPTTGYGFFQLSRVIQDYIKSEVPKTPYSNINNAVASSTAPTNLITVYCKFGEEYDSSSDCTGPVTQYTNLSTSNTFYVYEGVKDYEDFPSYDWTDYIVGTNSTATFLTNSPREIEVTYNDSYFLDFLSNQTITGSYSVEITGYNWDGSQNFSNTYTSTLANRRRYRLAVGPYDINKVETQPAIAQDIKYYEVKLQWMGTDISETFTFNVRPPKKYQTRIGFIGQLGGIEHFTFYHRNVKSFEVERKNFERTLQSNYSGNWSYQVGDRGTTTYAVKAKETHRVSSYCERNVALWLHEMWLSPSVWTYKRPELLPFRIFQDGLYMKFWLNEGHGLVAGDQIIVFPDTSNNDYEDIFTITSVNGNIVDCGLLASIYNQGEACGWLHKFSNWQVLPIVISDNNVEVKEKTSKPVEYSLTYTTAYSKNTLRN